MNRHLLTAIPLALAAAACSGGAGGSGANGSADTNTGSNPNVDSLGCGDGVKSAPNAWFVTIPSGDTSGFFQELALLSSNLFNITGVSPVNPATQSGSTVFPVDVTQTTGLIFDVSFTPGVDTAAFPTIAADSVTNRDAVLTQLQSLGATIGCNTIGVAQPLSGSGGGSTGSSSGASGGSTPDAAGCGDGVTSVPNSWFVTINKTSANAAIFAEVTLLSSNLFSVDTVSPNNPATQAGSTVFPVDVTQTTAEIFLVDFTPGVDSLAFPTIAADSINNRNAVLLTLQGDGLTVGCNQLGVANPLGQ